MSAAIKQKLIELNEKVKKLEAAAANAGGKIEDLKSRPASAAPGKAARAQADLFTVFTGGQQKDAMKSMASRLDSTIEKVEELLRQN